MSPDAEPTAEIDLTQHVAEVVRSPGKKFKDTRLGKLAAEWWQPEKRLPLAIALLEASDQCQDKPSREGLLDSLASVLRRELPFTESHIDLLLRAVKSTESVGSLLELLPGVFGAIERVVGIETLANEHRQVLLTIREKLRQADKKQQQNARKLMERIDRLIDDSTVARLHSDEGWADYLQQWIGALDPADRSRWELFLRDVARVRPEPPATEWKVTLNEVVPDYLMLLGDLEAAKQARYQRQLGLAPSQVWKQEIAAHLTSLQPERVGECLQRCLHKVAGSKRATLLGRTSNRELLRGLLWICVELGRQELVPAVQDATKFFYKNNSPLAETGVAVLYQMGSNVAATALEALARFVRAESQRSFIEFAQSNLAEKLGVESDQLLVPDFGFTEAGGLTRDLGRFRAKLSIRSSRASEISWSRIGGTALKSVPAAVKRDHRDEVESLKTTAKGACEALSALAVKLESGYLRTTKYPPENWHQQLIEHTVGGVLGRQLIWQLGEHESAIVFSWRDGALVDSKGHSVAFPLGSPVTLWHPLNATSKEVLAWRNRLHADGVTQPFKQAHREIYKLTDAERQTDTHSNRFAAHILRQAQFRQLAKSRGWKIGLCGPWDGGDRQAAERKLPHWGVRAEFWVTGVGDALHDYTLVATDQVRFYRHEASRVSDEPLGLEAIPPLVFSEIMRDVDLFVGVASVGNNPDWVDGGPGGQYRDYWHSYSFGELSATAQTRKAVLERLIPRLKIAERCSFADKFLVLRGDLRTYKIHLGSGNILMAPNDQYLCIVPSRGATAKSDGKVFLPFEGDNVLSIILSKAFLLAEDKKITDPTILNQIRRTT
jgi:hypothetical protein